MLIRSVRLENFKRFEKLEIAFRSLAILLQSDDLAQEIHQLAHKLARFAGVEFE